MNEVEKKGIKKLLTDVITLHLSYDRNFKRTLDDFVINRMVDEYDEMVAKNKSLDISIEDWYEEVLSEVCDHEEYEIEDQDRFITDGEERIEWTERVAVCKYCGKQGRITVCESEDGKETVIEWE